MRFCVYLIGILSMMLHFSWSKSIFHVNCTAAVNATALKYQNLTDAFDKAANVTKTNPKEELEIHLHDNCSYSLPSKKFTLTANSLLISGDDPSLQKITFDQNTSLQFTIESVIFQKVTLLLNITTKGEPQNIKIAGSKLKINTVIMTGTTKSILMNAVSGDAVIQNTTIRNLNSSASFLIFGAKKSWDNTNITMNNFSIVNTTIDSREKTYFMAVYGKFDVNDLQLQSIKNSTTNGTVHGGSIVYFEAPDGNLKKVKIMNVTRLGSVGLVYRNIVEKEGHLNVEDFNCSNNQNILWCVDIKFIDKILVKTTITRSTFANNTLRNTEILAVEGYTEAIISNTNFINNSLEVSGVFTFRKYTLSFATFIQTKHVELKDMIFQQNFVRVYSTTIPTSTDYWKGRKQVQISGVFLADSRFCDTNLGVLCSIDVANSKFLSNKIELMEKIHPLLNFSSIAFINTESTTIMGTLVESNQVITQKLPPNSNFYEFAFVRGALVASAQKVWFRYNTFRENTGYFGAGFSFLPEELMECRILDSTFYKNQALYGADVYLERSQVYVMLQIEWSNFTVVSNSSNIHIDLSNNYYNSYSKIEKCIFNITANSPTAAIVTGNAGTSWIYVFQSNFFGDGRPSTAHKCFEITGGLFRFWNSNIKNISFYNVSNSLMYFSRNTEVLLHYSTIENIQVGVYSAIVLQSPQHARFEYLEMHNISIPEAQAGYLTLAAKQKLEKSLQRGNFLDITISGDNSQVLKVEIRIMVCTFDDMNFNFLQRSAVAINCLYFCETEVHIHFSTFVNIKSALHLSALRTIEGDNIENSMISILYVNVWGSRFENNTGTYGGAVKCLYCELKVSETRFISNFAQRGGAIYLLASTRSKIFDITNGVIFQNNVALELGGAIYTLGNITVKRDTNEKNQFIGNTNYALKNGDRIHENPVKYTFLIPKNVTDYFKDSSVGYVMPSNFNEILASLNPRDTVLWSRDYSRIDRLINTYDTVYLRNMSVPRASANDTKLGLHFWELNNIDKLLALQPSGYPIYFPVYALAYQVTGEVMLYLDDVSAKIGLGINSVPKDQSIYLHQQGELKIYHNLLISLSEINVVGPRDFEIKFSNPVTRSKEPIPPINFKMKLRRCVPGEIFNKAGQQCEKCIPGKYSFHPEKNNTICDNCPKNANCTGGSNIVVNPGYWRMNNVSSEIYRCKQNSSCLGGLDSKCNISYAGPLCGVCDKTGENGTRYTYSGYYNCVKCSWIYHLLLPIVLLVFHIGLLIFQVTSTLKTARALAKKKEKGEEISKDIKETGIIIKFLVNYSQVVSLGKSIGVQFPGLFTVTSSIEAPQFKGIMHGFNCYQEYNDNIQYINMVIVLMVPVVELLIGYGYIIVRYFVMKDRAYRGRSYMTTLALILYYQFLPQVLAILIGVWNCKEFRENDNDRDSKKMNQWSLYLDYSCDTEIHKTFKIVFLVLLVFLVLIVPVAIYVMLHKNRFNLNDMELNLQYGFLFNEYKVNYYYWEIPRTYLKIVMITLTLMNLDLKYKVLGLLGYLALYHELARRMMPYRTQTLNDWDQESIRNFMITFYLLYMVQGEQGEMSDELIWCAWIVIVYINIKFILTLGRIVALDYLDQVYQVVENKSPDIARTLSKYIPRPEQQQQQQEPTTPEPLESSSLPKSKEDTTPVRAGTIELMPVVVATTGEQQPGLSNTVPSLMNQTSPDTSGALREPLSPKANEA